MKFWRRFRTTRFYLLWQVCMAPFCFIFHVAGRDGLSAGAPWFRAFGLSILCGGLAALAIAAAYAALLAIYYRARRTVLAVRSAYRLGS
jgi:hypothetical protein